MLCVVGHMCKIVLEVKLIEIFLVKFIDFLMRRDKSFQIQPLILDVKFYEKTISRNNEVY